LAVLPELADLPESAGLPGMTDLPGLPAPGILALLPPDVFILLLLTLHAFQLISNLAIFARPEKHRKASGPGE